MIPDSDLEKQLTDDIAIQATQDDADPDSVDVGDETDPLSANDQGESDPDEAAAMEAVQKEAAEERKEGGYQ